MNETPLFFLRLRIFIRCLWIAAGLLVVTHVLNRLIGGRLPIETANFFLENFHLDSENSIAAWFNSKLLLLVAAGWLMLWWCKYHDWEKLKWWRFALLAVVFVAMSADETASMHELLIQPVRKHLGVGGFLYLAWIIPAAVFLVCLGATVAPLVFRVSARLRWGSVLAGAVYISGAIGAEMIGGKIIDDGGFGNTAYFAAITLEEGFELLGLLLMLTVMASDLTATEEKLAAMEMAPA